jgi:hypothetical protein
MATQPGAKPAQTLDCKGLLCPVPIIRLSKAIKTIQVGEAIEMLATDPLAAGHGGLRSRPATRLESGQQGACFDSWFDGPSRSFRGGCYERERHQAPGTGGLKGTLIGIPP